MSIPPPLNGLKTHPLTAHAYSVLEQIEQAPLPRHEVNPGAANRLLREALAEWVDLPNPCPTSVRKQPKIPHLQITDAGRQALAMRKQ